MTLFLSLNESRRFYSEWFDIMGFGVRQVWAWILTLPLCAPSRYIIVLDRIMFPFISKDVHAQSQESVNILWYMERGTLYMWLKRDLKIGGFILDCIGGPNVITRVLKRWTRKAEESKETWLWKRSQSYRMANFESGERGHSKEIQEAY